jgi:adenosylhomocysteinase
MAWGAEIRDAALADEGLRRIDWAAGEMPVLRQIAARFAVERPLAGLRLAACLHVTAKTANLMRTLAAGGADLLLVASNPLSTQDDIAAALVVHEEIPVFAIRGEDHATYHRHLSLALDHAPQLVIDDGADLASAIVTRRRDLVPGLLGGTEETTTGVQRLRAMALAGVLPFPVVAVNDSDTKHLFDNRHGTGQSTLDGIMRATNILLAGKTFVVAGYGACGRGLAGRARGMGAHVIVCEVDPVRALEAALDGHRVLPLRAAAAEADIIVTATGNRCVVDAAAVAVVKDGCLLANSGHFNVEIDLPALAAAAVSCDAPRAGVVRYQLADGRRVSLLGEGRLVNLACAEGHPPAVMDLSFANQALAAEYLVRQAGRLGAGVHRLPADIDRRIASLKLEALGIAIDVLTADQQRYLQSWHEGT